MDGIFLRPDRIRQEPTKQNQRNKTLQGRFSGCCAKDASYDPDTQSRSQTRRKTTAESRLQDNKCPGNRVGSQANQGFFETIPQFPSGYANARLADDYQ